SPVPRWIWPEKVRFAPWSDTGIIHSLIGLSIPTSYETTLYANFSWVGVILGMAFLGVVHHGAYAWLRRYRQDPSVVLLYGMFILHFMPTALCMASLLQYFVTSWLAVRFVGRRIPAAP